MAELPLARKMHRTLEAYHAVGYFTPETEPYRRLGLTRRQPYFAARSAALGPAPVELVIATFYNFHPDLVRAAMDGVWAATTPDAVLEARMATNDAGLRAVLPAEALTSPEMAEAAGLARVAAEAASTDLAGRPLFAAHAALPWPDGAHLVLWHALTLLREHRGDGHIAALVVAGLDPCEALVTHASAGADLFTAKVLQSSRAWSDGEWQAAGDRLRDRGLLDGDNALTAEGARLRQEVEDQTDAAAAGPWAALGTEKADRLRALVRPFSRTVVDSGVLFNDIWGA
jgi:hypothetical protein